jgi:ATP-dependent Clp protease ATP-binding subunit ClpC
MDRDITLKVKTIINKASDEAKAFHDVVIRPEHIILAMLNDNDNMCVTVFQRLQVDTSFLIDKITELLNYVDLTPRVGPQRKKLPFSDESKLVLKNLDEQCVKLKESIIDTHHIMLSILGVLLTPLSAILSNVGVTYQTFKNQFMEIKNNKFGGENYEDDDFPDQEKFKKPKKKNEASKTPVLDNFCRDIIKAVERGEIDPVIGRTKEIKRVSQILSRRKKNSPLLIGEPGTGKSAIVEGLAILIHKGDVPRPLIGKRIFTLDIASIVAGTKYRGQFEERMKAILEECKANPDIILFIDEMHTIVGAGNASGSLDVSNIFKPPLARGELQVIGATTLDEYREYIEKDAALTRRFLKVLVEQPTLDETKNILMNIKSKYETHHRVEFTEQAIDDCVRLADRYITERAMPDKAIDVLDEAGAASNLEFERPQHIKELQTKREEIQIKKKEVVSKQNFEVAAKLRDEERRIDEQLDKAIKEHNETLDKKVTIVDSDQIAEVVSMMTDIPITKVSIEEGKKLLHLDKELMGKIIGQDDAVIKVVKSIKRNRAGIKDEKKPIGNFIFLGPTGVGKTELAKLLAKHVYGSEDALVRFDMSEYMEKHTVSRLVGAPPGYVGYEQGGQLTEKVRRKPYCVVLLDEIEKAHEDVYNILLQVFDDGILTDGLGRRVDFKNTLIIMTSNVGASELAAFGRGVGFQTQSSTANDIATDQARIEKSLRKKFRPEFLNRLDDYIVFNKLSKEDIQKIVRLEIKILEKRLQKQKYKINITDEAVEFVGSRGYSPEFGARPLKRTIQRLIEDKISDEILSGNLLENDTIEVGFDKEEERLTFNTIQHS